MAFETTNGSFGETIRRTIQDQSGDAIDISGATTKVFYLRAPSGTVKTATASFETDGTDGVLTYVIATGVIDETGPWQLETRVVTSSIDKTSKPEDWAQVHERFV